LGGYTKLENISNYQWTFRGVEFFDSGCKVKSKGYSSSKNFKIIAFLVTGKLDFGKINPAYGMFK